MSAFESPKLNRLGKQEYGEDDEETTPEVVVVVVVVAMVSPIA